MKNCILRAGALILALLMVLSGCAVTDEPPKPEETNVPVPTEASTEPTETEPADPFSYEMRSETVEFTLSDGRVYYRQHWIFPYFLGDSELAESINSRYSSMIEDASKNTTDFDAEYASLITYRPDEIDGELPYYLETNAEIVYCARGVVSINESCEY